MPTYEYECAKCGEHVEAFQTFSEEPLRRHNQCDGSKCTGTLQKVFSPVGIVLKGSGFYKNDSRDSSRSKSKASSSAAESKSSDSTSDSKSSDSKSDAEGDHDEVGQPEAPRDRPTARVARTRRRRQSRPRSRPEPPLDPRGARRFPPALSPPPPPPIPAPCRKGSAMLRRSPRAVLLWTAAVIVALVTAGYVANILVSLRHQDEAFGQVHTVVVASRDLPLGRRVRAGDLADRHVRGEADEPGAHVARRPMRSAGWLRSRCSAVPSSPTATSRPIDATGATARCPPGSARCGS